MRILSVNGVDVSDATKKDCSAQIGGSGLLKQKKGLVLILEILGNVAGSN